MTLPLPHVIRTFNVCLLCLALCAFAHSQTRRSKPPPGKESLEKRSALLRLQGIGDKARTLDNSINKTRILLSVADALWEGNESRARQLFTAAFESVDGIKLDPKYDQREAMAQKREGRFGPLYHLRSTVLERIARRDLKLAETLRQSYELNMASDSRAEAVKKAEFSQLYLNLAVALAKTRPDEALRLLRLRMTEVDMPLIVALIKVRAENSQLADAAFVEALSRTRANPLTSDQFGSFAIYVLPNEEDRFFGRDPLDDPSRSVSTAKFLDYVFNGLTQVASNPADNEIDAARADTDYHLLKSMLPLFQRLQPDRVSFVNQRMGVLLALMSPGDANAAEPVPVEKLEDLVRQAEATVGDRKRDVLFMRASNAAVQQDDLEKALSLAERMSDPSERKIQASLVLYHAAVKELQEGKIERAYAFARQIEFLPQRVAVFERLAQTLWADKQSDAAEAKMDELWEWLSKTDNSPTKVDAMLKLTAAVAPHDTVRAFEWLQSTTRFLNNTDFTPPPVEFNRISVEVQITLDMLDLESSFGPLARADFERAFSIAHSLTKPEVALLAETIVCTHLLQSR